MTRPGLEAFPLWHSFGNSAMAWVVLSGPLQQCMWYRNEMITCANVGGTITNFEREQVK